MPNQPNSIELATKILKILDASWVEASDFEQFSEYLHLQPGPQKVDALQRLIALIKRIPTKILDIEHREKVIDAAQQYLESAIEEEDQLEEEL